MTSWEKRDEKNIVTAATLVKQGEKTNVAVDMGHWESSQRRMVIKTRPARELDTSRGEAGETSEGVLTDGWTERETRGDWSHLYGPEYCYVCGQNPFECGCLNVNFESRREKRWREDRERERGTGKMFWDGSGGCFERDAGGNGGTVTSC